MVALLRIHYGILHYGFSFYAANFGRLVDVGAILLVTESVLDLCRIYEKEASCSEPPAIGLTGYVESLCRMQVDRELLATHLCDVL